MGLLSDTLEDNRERVAQLETPTYRRAKRPRRATAIFACPICDQEFSAEVAQLNHVAREHAKSHVYIKADGAIVRRTKVFEERPQSLELIPHKIPQVHVTVQLGRKKSSFRADRTLDLAPRVPADYTGEMRVSVSHDHIRQQFLLYIGVAPPFDQAKLDAEVVALQQCLERGDEPDWAHFQRRQLELAQNDLEKQYLDGFLEYSWGFHREKRSQWQESGTHLEQAMDLLLAYDADSEFSTSMALTALRVLAVRMNCFTPLRQCRKSSVFYRAKSFFLNGALELPSNSSKDTGRSGGSVYIDGFTEQYLLALKAFYARDFTTVTGLVDSLSAHPLAEDKNNDDKLSLLRARTARIRGNHEQARAVYDNLRYHPLFGHESEAFGTSLRSK